MTEPPVRLGQLRANSINILRRLQPMVANRLELMGLEMHEERPRLLQGLLLVLGTALCLLMGVVSLTVLLVVLGWNISPALVLGIISALYLGGGWFLSRKLMALFEDWHPLPATRDQFAKDRDGIRQIMK